MIKNFLSALALVLMTSTQSQAAMICEVTETSGKNQATQTLTVEVQKDNPHGSLLYFGLSKFTQFNGMIAFLRGYAVISIHDLKSGFALSSHSKITATESAQQQVILPTADHSTQAINVECKLAE